MKSTSRPKLEKEISSATGARAKSDTALASPKPIDDQESALFGLPTSPHPQISEGTYEIRVHNDDKYKCNFLYQLFEDLLFYCNQGFTSSWWKRSRRSQAWWMSQCRRVRSGWGFLRFITGMRQKCVNEIRCRVKYNRTKESQHMGKFRGMIEYWIRWWCVEAIWNNKIRMVVFNSKWYSFANVELGCLPNTEQVRSRKRMEEHSLGLSTYTSWTASMETLNHCHDVDFIWKDGIRTNSSSLIRYSAMKLGHSYRDISWTLETATSEALRVQMVQMVQKVVSDTFLCILSRFLLYWTTLNLHTCYIEMTSDTGVIPCCKLLDKQLIVVGERKLLDKLWDHCNRIERK